MEGSSFSQFYTEGVAVTKYIWYKWDEMRKDVNSLIRAVVLDKFTPEVIVGISRGGLTPGVMLSHWFQKPFKPIKASIRDFPEWEDYLPRKTDKRILIVDDICDSGKTFQKISKHIKNRSGGDLVHNKADIRFASLWWNNECEFDGKMCVCNILLQTVVQIRVDNLCIMIDYRLSLRY